jgi:hypothetical protein
MSSSNTNTFEQTPPRRPTIDDVGGGAKENRTPAPDPVRDATAEDFNQLGRQAASAGTMIPLVRLFVTISGGVPVVASVMSPSSLVSTGSFTVTDNADGDTTISWAAALLPTRASAPGGLTQTDDVEIDRLRALYTTAAVPAANSPAVRVKSKLGATGTDCNFVVDIY